MFGEKYMNEIEKHSYTTKPVNLTLIFFVYLIFTLILYILGPYDWNTHNAFITYFLLILYLVAFYLGGKRGMRSIKYDTVNKSKVISKYYIVLLKWYYPIAFITIVLSFVSLQRVTSLYGLSGLTDLFTSLTGDYKSLYFAKETASVGADMYGGTLFSLASIVFSPITLLFILFTIVAFKDLTFFQKVIGVIGVLFRILSNISKGSNYSIFSVIIPIFVARLVISKRKSDRKRKRSKKSVFWIVLCGVIVVYLFYVVMDNRMSGKLNFIQIGENKVDYNHPLLNILPNGLKKTLIWLEFYLCQGYYGFSLATDVPWWPMFGAGFSRWLCLELNSFIPIYQNTYVYRIGETFYWDASANWHTAYTWFANDVGLLGVIVVMFIIGYILQRSCNASVDTLNPFSMGLLCLTIQMVIFLPCNNLIFSDSKTFISFLIYLIGHHLTKKEVISRE